MTKIFKLILICFIAINLTNFVIAENNFFKEGKKKYVEKKYEESKIFISKKYSF